MVKVWIKNGKEMMIKNGKEMIYVKKIVDKKGFAYLEKVVDNQIEVERTNEL